MGAGGIQLDSCGACGGVWLDKGELGVYIKDIGRFDAAVSEALPAAKTGARMCPRCEKRMATVQLSQASTELDACSACSGLWLDKDEFAALKKFFP